MPDRAEPVARRAGSRTWPRRGLGEPVALEDQHAGGVEPLGDVAGQRRPSRRRRSGSARRTAPGSCENTSLSATACWSAQEPRRLLPRLPQPARPAADAERPVEDLGLGAALRLRLRQRTLECTFSKMRGAPAMKVGRTTAEVLDDLVEVAVDRGREADRASGPPSSSLPKECDSGSHRYCRSSVVRMLEAVDGGAPRTASSRGPADALGPAGRARGVDQGRQVLRAHGVDALRHGVRRAGQQLTPTTTQLDQTTAPADPPQGPTAARSPRGPSPRRRTAREGSTTARRPSPAGTASSANTTREAESARMNWTSDVDVDG